MLAGLFFWATITLALIFLAGFHLAVHEIGPALFCSLTGLTMFGAMVIRLADYKIEDEFRARSAETEQVESNKQGVIENE